MDPRTVVVTGANSGIGKSLATSLAKAGDHVVMVCRNVARGEEALADVKKASGNGRVELEICDVGDMRSVRDFTSRWKSRRGRIDVLANNAGVYLPRRSMTNDGIESTFAINHVGAFLLTMSLLDRLDGARVITTSSGAHAFGRLDLATVTNPGFYVPMRVYGTSKLCNILFTRELAKRYANRGIAASCFHPGAVGTGFAQDESGLLNVGMKIGKLFLLSPEQGADTGLFLATSEEGGKARGGYYYKRREVRPMRAGRDDASAEALWNRSLELTGLSA